jgi:hypothetical protein
VIELTPELLVLLELEVAGVDVVLVALVLVVGVEVVVGVVVELTEAVLLWAARAGSLPLISTMVMSSQVATNRAREPATTRWRIMRTRARRACLGRADCAPGRGSRVRVIRILAQIRWAARVRASPSRVAVG